MKTILRTAVLSLVVLLTQETKTATLGGAAYGEDLQEVLLTTPCDDGICIFDPLNLELLGHIALPNIAYGVKASPDGCRR